MNELLPIMSRYYKKHANVRNRETDTVRQQGYSYVMAPK